MVNVHDLRVDNWLQRRITIGSQPKIYYGQVSRIHIGGFTVNGDKDGRDWEGSCKNAALRYMQLGQKGSPKPQPFGVPSQYILNMVSYLKF
jgi:hypothetical protein